VAVSKLPLVNKLARTVAGIIRPSTKTIDVKKQNFLYVITRLLSSSFHNTPFFFFTSTTNKKFVILDKHPQHNAGCGLYLVTHQANLHHKTYACLEQLPKQALKVPDTTYKCRYINFSTLKDNLSGFLQFNRLSASLSAGAVDSRITSLSVSLIHSGLAFPKLLICLNSSFAATRPICSDLKSTKVKSAFVALQLQQTYEH